MPLYSPDRQFPTNGEYTVQPFVRLGCEVGGEDKGTCLRLALKPFQVTKNPDASLQWSWPDGTAASAKAAHEEKYPNYVDMQLQHVKTVFEIEGAAMSNAKVKCILSMKSGFVPGNTVQYITHLDQNGGIEAVLCPSFVTQITITSADDKSRLPDVKVPARPVEKIDPEKPKKPQTIKRRTRSRRTFSETSSTSTQSSCATRRARWGAK
jgi:hypothetical protein